MKKTKQYTVEDVRDYVSNMRKEADNLTWTIALPILRAKFPEQLIIRYLHST